MSATTKQRVAQTTVAGGTPPSTGVQTAKVSADESGMRVDRFLEARFPGLSFSHIQRIIRKGELRVNGKRAKPKDRLAAGQSVRIPPLKLNEERPRATGSEADSKTRDFLRSITLHEDADVLVLNKPMGLAVQGGSGTTRHIDGMLDVLRDAQGQRPRLVHRLDKDTAGCLLIAKSRFAAAALAKTFRSPSAPKVYRALVAGLPNRGATSARGDNRHHRAAAAAHAAIVEPAGVRCDALRSHRRGAGRVIGLVGAMNHPALHLVGRIPMSYSCESVLDAC